MSQQQGRNFALDYIDVAERIVEFRGKHPDGSLQPADPATPYRVETIGDQTFIVVVAAAYRSGDDPRPGIGMAYEQFPGRTPYTRGSELQNAETSAWGRAIVAALAADTKRGIASAEEVRNRREEQNAPTVPEQRKPSQADQVREQIRRWAEGADLTLAEVATKFGQKYGRPIQDEENAGVLTTFFAELQAEAKGQTKATKGAEK